MTAYTVDIPPRVVAGMRRHAAATAPAECCGALLGRRSGSRVHIRCVVPLENTAPEPDRYEIDAVTVLRVERYASSAGMQLIGFYHSHPHGAAEPSPRDLELASPGFLYVIIAADTGDVRGWLLRDDRGGFDELRLNRIAGAA